jgi:hypothetical protein
MAASRVHYAVDFVPAAAFELGEDSVTPATLSKSACSRGGEGRGASSTEWELLFPKSCNGPLHPKNSSGSSGPRVW